MKDKRLDKSDVMQHLQQYNEREFFYQQYAALRNDQEALQGFLQQFDKAALKQKGIYIAEILPQSCKEFEEEAVMWLGRENAIHIEKYSRLMPPLAAVHDYFEILYVVENEMCLDLGEKSITLKAGDVCFLSPGILHSPHILEQTLALQMIVRKSTFKQEFFRCLTGNSPISDFFLNALYLRKAGGALLFRMDEEEEIKNVFFQMYQENFNQEIGYQKIMNNLFEILLCHLLRCDFSRIEMIHTCQDSDSRITQILQHMENNYEALTIEALSREFHLTKSYLSKYITLTTGKSFRSILQEIRLEKAHSMLCSSSLRVEDISGAVGYQNVEHFIRLFKRKYGDTPNQFRKGK